MSEDPTQLPPREPKEKKHSQGRLLLIALLPAAYGLLLVTIKPPFFDIPLMLIFVGLNLYCSFVAAYRSARRFTNVFSRAIYVLIVGLLLLYINLVLVFAGCMLQPKQP